jgi:hypothetical protein
MGVNVFDSGQAKPQRALLVDAIAAKVADLMRVNGRYLRLVARIARIVEKSIKETHDMFGLHLVEEASLGNMPCLLVALGHAPYTPQSTDPIDMSAELDVQLLIVSSNLGGYVVGRLAPDVASDATATLDPGIDTMLEHLEERLMGQELGVDGIHELRWHTVDEVFTSNEYTVWEARATCLLERHVNPDRDEDRIVVEVETKNELDGIPPGGQLDPIVDSVVTLPLEDP